jgi:hypothetical protein
MQLARPHVEVGRHRSRDHLRHRLFYVQMGALLSPSRRER